MKRVMQVTVNAVWCFALIDCWGPASAQQPNAPELFRPAVCDQLNIDGRASSPLRTVTLPPLQSCDDPHQ